jgi:hypothetical protein
MTMRRRNPWRLRVGSREVLVVPRHQLRAEESAHPSARLLARVHIERDIAIWVADPALRPLVHEMIERFRGPHARSISPRGDARLASTLSRLFADGVLVALALSRASAGEVLAEVADETPPPVGPPSDTDAKTWVSIRLIDAASKPVRGHRFRITLPDGNVRDGMTNDQGMAYFADIDPGECKFELPGTDGADWARA